ncbi:MAG: endo-1,4-beta-xylanase, partial [Schleiferiaceae bacterium]|nr:endo-1,4-beta-xylanase [Schleiferiaceae bacterium]
WHNQIPYWMEHYQGSREDWIAMMKTHIQTVVGHYKGKIKAWDVINEGFLSNGTLRNSIWKQNIGPEYLELAFRFAHEADPNALLFYNDFNLALNPVKREAVLRFFKKLKLRGVPIDGIGLQMHIGINFPERTEITRALLETAEEGFLVHISELDVVVNAFGKEMPQPSNEDLNRQADVYSYVFNTFKKLPKHQQYGITIWGVDDGNSWIRPHFNRNDFPLLFDANYLPKPAYCRLISAL